MTKIHPADIIEHLRANRSKAKYEDFIFPEELTAEHMASVFGTNKVTAQRRLNQMEEEGIIVSKKGYVRDKPGKRYIFFLKEDLVESKGDFSIASGSSPPYFGYRELLYEDMRRISKILKNGDAIVTFDYIIKNISNKDISEIHIPGFKFSTADLSQRFDELIKVEVDDQPISYPLEALRYYKESQPGKVNPTISFTKSKFHSTVSYTIPLEKALKPGNNVRLKLETSILGSYTNLFKYEYTGLTIGEITLKASIKIIAPEGCTIKSVKSYEDLKFQHGVYIQEVSSGLRRPDLEPEIDFKNTKKALKCNIDKPVIGYRYLVPFFVIE